MSEPGLEKLINANRSIISVNDRLFPIELTNGNSRLEVFVRIYVTFEFRKKP